MPQITPSQLDLNTTTLVGRADALKGPAREITLANSLTMSGNALGVNLSTGAVADALTSLYSYVDNAVQGLDAKQSVKTATSVNITLSTTQTISGVAVGVGDRVLVKSQTQASQNGVWVVATGSWTRAQDMNLWSEVPGAFVFVEAGTFAGSGWVCTSTQGGTLDTTVITWAQFSGTGAYTATGGVLLSGTVFSLAPAPALTLKGNATGATATPADISVASIRSMLSINNLDNTSDANKPVSTAQAAADALKAPLINPVFTQSVFVAQGVVARNGSAGQVVMGDDPNNNGNIEIGQQGRATAGSPYIDFHSAANSGDFDVRIMATGGVTTAAGAGDISFFAANATFLGSLTATGKMIAGGTMVIQGGGGEGGQLVFGFDNVLATGEQAGTWNLDVYADLFRMYSVDRSGASKIAMTASPTTGVIDFNNSPTFVGAKIWSERNHGGGSGLDADLLDGQHGNYYTNIPARLGFNPLNNLGDSIYGDLLFQKGKAISWGDANAQVFVQDKPAWLGLDNVMTMRVYGSPTPGAGGGAFHFRRQESPTSGYGMATLDGTGLSVTGNINATGNVITPQLQTTSGDGIRIRSSGGTVIHRNDGANYYLLLTDTTTPDASWNGLRPLYINLASGNVTSGVSWNITGTVTAGAFSGPHTGNSTTATTLQTARTIGMTGDVSWTSASFNGSANVTGTATLATVNGNVGTFGTAATGTGTSSTAAVFTVNAKGLITGAYNTTITPSWSSITSKPTTIAGYGITDDIVSTSTTGIGLVGNGSYNTTLTSPAAWANLPVGYARMIWDGVGLARGAPLNAYGYFHKFANRDTGGGWAGLWVGYTAGNSFIGRTETSTAYATWERIWTDANDGLGSGLDADLLDGRQTGTSGNTIPVLNASNTWSAQQAFAVPIYTQGGIGAPTATNRSAGTRVIWYPQVDASNVDFATGIDNSTLWTSVPNSSNKFDWYSGISRIATLSGAGTLGVLGQVGIGKLSTVAPLDIANLNATAYYSQAIFTRHIGDSAFFVGVRTGDTGNAVGSIVGRLALSYGETPNSSVNFHRGGSSDDGFLSFTTRGIERLRLENNGAVNVAAGGTMLVPGKVQITDGVAADTAGYGTFGVTRAAVGTNPAYIVMTRSGNIVYGMGVSSANTMIVGLIGASEQVQGAMHINSTGVGIRTVPAYQFESKGNTSNFYPDNNPTSFATTRQVTIGEGSNNASYRLALGYYHDGNGWSGVIQATAAANPGPLYINPMGGSIQMGNNQSTRGTNIAAAVAIYTTADTAGPGAPWDSRHVTIGQNTQGGNSGALALSYNSNGNGTSWLTSLRPGVSWSDMNFAAQSFQFMPSNSTRVFYIDAGQVLISTALNAPGQTAKFGDVYASRSSNTGVLYLGTDNTRYLYFDGASYIMPNSELIVNGVKVTEGMRKGNHTTMTAAANLAAGWYTIATNGGDRASARFVLRDTSSGNHQAIVLYAAVHFGAGSTINVLSESRYGGSPYRYARIMTGTTYDGAMLQVYIDGDTGATNALEAYIAGDNMHVGGWTPKNFIPAGTDPGSLTSFAAIINQQAYTDFDDIANGFGVSGTAKVGTLKVGNFVGAIATPVPSYIQLDNSYRNATNSRDNLKIYLYRNTGADTYGFGLNDTSGIEYRASATSVGNHKFYTGDTLLLTIGDGGLATSRTMTVDQIITTRNSAGMNVRVGDDLWLGDIDSPDTALVRGTNDATSGFFKFGNAGPRVGAQSNGKFAVNGNSVFYANYVAPSAEALSFTSSSGAQLRVGGADPSVSPGAPNASVHVSNGNLHIDSAAAYGLYLNFYRGQSIIMGNGTSGVVHTFNGGGANISGTVTSGYLRTTAVGVWNGTTPGTGLGTLHIGAQSSTANAGAAITFEARDGGATGQAGIYVNTDGTYGTKMYLATTDNYSTGAKTSLSLDQSGNVVIPRGSLTVATNFVAAGAANIGGALNSGGLIQGQAFKPIGEGGDSGFTNNNGYIFGYQESGPWTHPYPDLVIGYHTGMKMGAVPSYGGIRFYDNHPSQTSNIIFSVGNGDSNVRVTNTMVAGNFETGGTFNIVGAPGANYISGGTGDGADFNTFNMRIRSWFGIGFTDNQDICRGVYNSRSGSWNVTGGYNISGFPVWSVFSAQVAADTLFNNNGVGHATYGDFNAVPTFGVKFFGGITTTNGPTGGSGDFYTNYVGLGSNYAATSYGLMTAIARGVDNYMYIRRREGGNWNGWVKIAAGNADNANTLGNVGKDTLPTAGTIVQRDGGGGIRAGTYYGAYYELLNTEAAERQITFRNAATGRATYLYSNGGATGYYDNQDGPIWAYGYGSGVLNVNKTLSVQNGISAGDKIIASQAGFASASFVSGRNPIWRFANSDNYGLSYMQGAGGWIGQDSISLHFGNPTNEGSEFKFRSDGAMEILADPLDLVFRARIANTTATTWYGRIMSSSTSGDSSAFIGLYGPNGSQKCVVAGHNDALSAWRALYINNVDGSTGGDVYLPNATYIGGQGVLKNTSGARPGVTRLYRRDEDSGFNVQVNWNGTRWVMYGYNGDAAHAGVHVNYADIAATATQAGNSDRIAGYSLAIGATANTVPLRNSDGQVFATYLNQSSPNSENNTVAQIMVSNGDGYLRKAEMGWFAGQIAANVKNTENTITGVNRFKANYNTGDSSNAPLQVYSEAGYGAVMAFHRGGYYAVNFGLDSDNVIRIGGWSAAANRLQLDMSGNLTLAGDVTAFSDRRLKSNIRPIENALDLVARMQGRRFIKDGRENIGFIAQEVREVIPEVVHEHNDEDKTLSVAYGNITALHNEAIKMLMDELKELRAEVAELRGAK